MTSVDILKQIKYFFDTIGIKSYPKPVPAKAEPPYISYEIQIANTLDLGLINITVWTKGYTDYLQAYEIADKITARIGYDGTVIGDTEVIGTKGGIAIVKGEPYIQEYLQDDINYRNLYIVLEFTALE